MDKNKSTKPQQSSNTAPNINNTKNNPKISNLNQPKMQKPLANEQKESCYTKINKPSELKNFDAQTHFRENIVHFDKNCQDPITDTSYYCLSCKNSICTKCGAFEHKDHLLIQRDNCLCYDKTFFIEINSVIENSLKFVNLKDSIKDRLSLSINSLKDQLDNLKATKFKEIDNFFAQTAKDLQEVKKKYLHARHEIENYYKNNKKFFNITICKDNEVNNDCEKNKEIKNEAITWENIAENCSTNRDLENTLFILNFELMNLCDNKNLEVLDLIYRVKNKIDGFSNQIENEYAIDLEKINQFFNLDLNAIKIEDYYWDVEFRTQKYSEIIQQFRETCVDILHRTGNLEKIKDLIDIFDSKNKKDSNIIFKQDYFKKQKNNKNVRPPERIDNRSRRTHQRVPSAGGQVRGSSKNKLSTRSSGFGMINQNYEKNKLLSSINNNTAVISAFEPELKGKTSTIPSERKNKKSSKSSCKNKVTVYPVSNPNNNTNIEINKDLKKDNINGGDALADKSASFRTFINCTPDDIILNQRVIQRFFAYSISEIYAKNFRMLDFNNLDELNNIQNKDNIYLIQYINNNGNPNENNKYYKNNKNKQNLTYNNKTYQGLKASNLKSTNSKAKLKRVNNYMDDEQSSVDINPYNLKSVSYLANYTNRYDSLKEYAKPLIGTNQVQLFNPITKKISRKTAPLTKEEHGYQVFPDGCRHILVDNILYIMGGTDKCRIPLKIVLSFNIVEDVLARLPDLNDVHCYHTVEYLENYNSLLCIGGENSNSCEIMNIDDKIWYNLPPLRYPRANTNIYFNNITGELFVLFGMYGIMTEKINNNCDAIEVLIINDIGKGWIKVDYYKTSGLNFKVNYCMTMPFTRDQLLIYGGSDMRNISRSNMYALFNMNKNECIKVDKDTMELIKLEERQSRLVDLLLTKLG